jgi:hypothetical protein
MQLNINVLTPTLPFDLEISYCPLHFQSCGVSNWQGPWLVGGLIMGNKANMYKRLSPPKKEVNEAQWIVAIIQARTTSTRYDQGSILPSISNEIFLTFLWPKLCGQYSLNDDFLDVLWAWRVVSKSWKEHAETILHWLAFNLAKGEVQNCKIFIGKERMKCVPITYDIWCRSICVATPLWPSVGVKPNTSKVGDLESSGTPECLEFNNKAQNTSMRGVLDVIGKVLKRRYRKWPRIGHLDICSPSYGQKKGRESNWQFDSRPLKVGNRPLHDLRIESAIRRWKDLDEGYKFGSNRVAIRLCSRELWAPKVPGLHPG